MSLLRPNRRKDRERDMDYMAWIKTFSCVVCTSGALKQNTLPKSECAHVGPRGLGQKSDDRQTIPLCSVHHRTGKDSHHKIGKFFWNEHGLDRDGLIEALNNLYDRQHKPETPEENQMSQLIVRGAMIKKSSMECNDEGFLVLDSLIRAPWNREVCEHFGWTQEPNGFGNGSLEPKSMAGISMSMEPNAANLKDYRFDIPISKAHSFKHITHTEDGKIVSREISFIVTTQAPDAVQVIAEYMRHCNPAGDTGQLKITYSAEEQGDLLDGTDVREAEGEPELAF